MNSKSEEVYVFLKVSLHASQWLEHKTGTVRGWTTVHYTLCTQSHSPDIKFKTNRISPIEHIRKELTIQKDLKIPNNK